MSHFVVLVLVDRPKAVLGERAPEQLLADLVEAPMAPFYEGLEVEPYKTDCYCVGSEARQAARAHAEATVEPFEAIRSRYWDGNKAYRHAHEGDEAALKDVEARLRDLGMDWASMTRRYEYVCSEAESAHPQFGKADPTCTECQGTGQRTTTYSPRSKWDWFVVGGRWNGFFGGYDPAADRRNYETCFLCQGAGQRNDDLGRKAREEDPSYTCNGCDGKGTRRMFSDAVKAGNHALVADILSREGEAFKKVVPFAVLTPDGEWHERGQMHMFATVSGEKESEVWADEVRGLLQRHPNSLAIAVDCHI